MRSVSGLVLVATATAGVVALNGGIAERKDATALAAASSVFVSAEGTVKAHAGNTSWSQMPVRFVTEDDEAVETMVWTRQGNRDFDKGQSVDLEYVSQRPTAARLAGNQGGTPESLMTIVAGAALLVGALVLGSAWVWDIASARRKRRA